MFVSGRKSKTKLMLVATTGKGHFLQLLRRRTQSDNKRPKKSKITKSLNISGTFFELR